MTSIKRMRPLLGTFVELGVLSDTHHSKADLQRAVNNAFAHIELIHRLLSFHNPDSDLTRLNSACGDWVDCHPLSIQCLRLARAMTRISKHNFNCTLGYSVVQKGALPAHRFTEHYKDQLLTRGNWQDLELKPQQARLNRPVLVSLDGIAKGFAVDQAIKSLKASGIASAWVNAGGDMRCYGDSLLPIAVRDHRQQEHLLGGLQNAAIATSTSAASRDYPGLLLGAEGQQQAPATWCVMAHSAWRADALTKVAANTAAAEREQFVRQLGGRWIPLPSAPENPSPSV